MTQPDAIVQCAYEGCTNTFTLKRPGSHQMYCQPMCCNRAGEQRELTGTCAGCGKGIRGRPPTSTSNTPRYCTVDCRDRAEGGNRKRGDVPRRDPYAAVCSMCGRSPSNEPLLLSDTELRALRPLPRCEHCGGATWVEPFETTAHRVGDVRPGTTAHGVAGWNYHEPVGEVAG